MRILALDPGKYKTVASDYEAETGRMASVCDGATTPKAQHDLIVDCAPQRVVIEICSIAGCAAPSDSLTAVRSGSVTTG